MFSVITTVLKSLERVLFKISSWVLLVDHCLDDLVLFQIHKDLFNAFDPEPSAHLYLFLIFSYKSFCK